MSDPATIISIITMVIRMLAEMAEAMTTVRNAIAQAREEGRDISNEDMEAINADMNEAVEKVRSAAARLKG